MFTILSMSAFSFCRKRNQSPNIYLIQSIHKHIHNWNSVFWVKIQFQDTIISKRYIKICSETNYSESHKRKRQKQSNGNQFYFSLILFDFFLFKKIETTESKHSIVKRTKNYHASDLSRVFIARTRTHTTAPYRQFIGHHIDLMLEIETIL